MEMTELLAENDACYIPPTLPGLTGCLQSVMRTSLQIRAPRSGFTLQHEELTLASPAGGWEGSAGLRREQPANPILCHPLLAACDVCLREDSTLQLYSH